MASKKKVSISKPVAIGKKAALWVLVADAGQAQIYERIAGDAHARLVGKYTLKPVLSRPVQAKKPESKIGHHALPMVINSASSVRHTIEPSVSIADAMRRDFMKEVAEILAKASKQRKFARLVLVAPARAIGDLQKSLNPHLSKKVVGKVAKELVHYPLPELNARLAPVLRRI